ncbi:MAG: 23S rRNA (guanosine(2251)-2'-O)-methyltransferase RlmB [Chloroflexi bacterium]|nr:MAG: 23S rRNA (guanosine(2251)-2'-O)-methyltransferase RlmB [Chloroflexota bacterium]RLT32275.1 MAG: 23S rRNA (guanosine(2251)-2'-O)-methyltransferase RlmB [Chloroflexota bacterium]
MTELIYGRNAVREALRAQRRVPQRLLVANGAQITGTLADAVAHAKEQNIPVEMVDKRLLESRLHGLNHQGVILECSEYPYSDLDDMLSLAKARNEMPFILLLDHLQDPQNLGTLLRTAEIVGIHGVIIPGRRAAEITPSVVNASSGAVEHLHIAVVTNLAQSIEKLQKHGVWVVGVEDDEKAQYYDQADLNMPLAVVLGSEGSGMARLTRERCDFMVKLPMHGQIQSLNVAVAGSVVLYHALHARSAAK